MGQVECVQGGLRLDLQQKGERKLIAHEKKRKYFFSFGFTIKSVKN